MHRKTVLVEFTIEAAEDDDIENLEESIDKLIEFLNITSLYIVEKVETSVTREREEGSLDELLDKGVERELTREDFT